MKRAPLVLACLLGQPGGASGPAPCEARLELFRQEQLLTITGHCRSLLSAPARYRYQLLVQRQGRNGHSQNSQGGTFVLTARQEAVLSRVQLNTNPQDLCIVHLLVFDAANQLIAQDSTRF